MPSSFGRGRSIVSQAGVWHEWDEEYEERGSGWWELFVDLILVAACANIADQFKDDSTWVGLAVFILQLTQFDSAWLHYTLFSSRYHDDSLFHSFLLFVYLLGTAVAVVHAKGLEYDDVVGFNIGQIILRLALLAMHLSVAYASSRARGIALVDALFTFVHACICCIAAAVANDGSSVLACWAACVFMEVVVWAQITRLLGVKGVPLNIDHMADRSGCFTMVVLGESVVSTAINYSNLASPERTVGYYAAMVLGFLLTFTLALSTFHMQPPRKLHAYRRSRCHGICLGTANRVMWTALLAMGVGIKQVMRAVTGTGDAEAAIPQDHDTPNDLLQARFVWLLMISLSLAFLCLAIIRAQHYWGRQPAPTDKPWVYRLKMAWWAMAFLWGVLPLAAGLALTSAAPSDSCSVGMCDTDPVLTLGAAAACTTLMVIMETIIVQCLPPPGEHAAENADDKDHTLLTPINQDSAE